MAGRQTLERTRYPGVYRAHRRLCEWKDGHGCKCPGSYQAGFTARGVGADPLETGMLGADRLETGMLGADPHETGMSRRATGPRVGSRRFVRQHLSGEGGLSRKKPARVAPCAPQSARLSIARRSALTGLKACGDANESVTVTHPRRRRRPRRPPPRPCRLYSLHPHGLGRKRA